MNVEISTIDERNARRDTEIQKIHFATKAIHVGQNPDKWTHKAIVQPISMSSTFKRLGPDQHAVFEYSRSGNPTRLCLEKCIAALEGGNYGICFSSGIAAIVSLTHLLRSGDHVVCFDDLYGGTNTNFRVCAADMGIEATFVDARDPDNVKNALKPNTKMVWMETPSNPTMKIVDIQAIAAISKDHPSSPILVVDNTFMTPYFQLPLQLGADVSMHSLTKYMNGHSDVVMGAIATNNQDIYKRLLFLQNALGGVPSPFDCYLVNRGLKTLNLRMERHMENGLAIAKFLENHPMVRRVLHPGLSSHPQHKLAEQQCSGYSGMCSFYINGGIDEAKEFLKHLKYFTLAGSLGCAESLIAMPSLMTHHVVPEEQREKFGITDNFFRISVGLEDKQDLLEDLNQALLAAQRKYNS